MVVSDDTLAEDLCHATTSISSRITTDWMGEREREREREREGEREREMSMPLSKYKIYPVQL